MRCFLTLYIKRFSGLLIAHPATIYSDIFIWLKITILYRCLNHILLKYSYFLQYLFCCFSMYNINNFRLQKFNYLVFIVVNTISQEGTRRNSLGAKFVERCHIADIRPILFRGSSVLESDLNNHISKLFQLSEYPFSFRRQPIVTH